MVVTHKKETVTVLLLAGHKTSNIIALAGVSRSLVDTVKILLKTGVLLDKRSRKPRTCTVRTPRLLFRLKKRIKATPFKSMRAHSKDLGISLNFVQRAVRNDLNGQSLVRKCVSLLSEKNVTARLKRCRNLVNHMKHAHSGRIIFPDEKNFCFDPVRNSRNDRYIRLEGSEVDEDVPTAAKFIKKTKYPASLMFLVAVASTGEALPPIWFPTGFRLSASKYQEVLQKTVIPWMKEVVEKHSKDFIFQQYGTPAHTAPSTQACLREAGVDFWQKNMFPPSSDLSPLDFSVWGHMSMARAWPTLNVIAV